MKRNDEARLQLYIDSEATIKNMETGAIEFSRRNIGNSSDVLYVNMSMNGSTESGHGNIYLDIKYKNADKIEHVMLDNISINIIKDVYDKLLEVLIIHTNDDILYLVRDVLIKQDHNEIVIIYKDKGNETIECKFDKMNTTDCIGPRVRSK